MPGGSKKVNKPALLDNFTDLNKQSHSAKSVFQSLDRICSSYTLNKFTIFL